MNVSEIVRARLTADLGVSALVSTRVKPVLVPDDVDLPAVAYLVQVDTPINGSAALQRCTVTCYCLAHAQADADSLADAVDAALNGYVAENSGTRLSELVRFSHDVLRDEELKVWGRTLVYAAWITY